MIVKDEHKELDRCLNSFHKYIDEIVIVANSPVTEDIKKVCKKYNANLFPRKWNNNFADARNYSFKKCKGDVIFWVDSDDTVINPEKLPELAKLITDNKTDWITLSYLYEKDDLGRLIMKHYKPRLTRAGTGYWEKSVHECYTPNKEVRQFISDDVMIDHHTKKGHENVSGARNLEILLEEYEKDKEKTDPRTLYYLGNTLSALGRFEEAIFFYRKHIEKCGWPEEKYFSLHYLAHCYHQIGNDDSAINISLEASKIFPVWCLAFFDLGWWHISKKQYKHAIEWIKTGFTKQHPDSKQYFINELEYIYYPLGRLADCYIETMQFDDAYKISKKLEKMYPQDKEVVKLVETCEEILDSENFVESLMVVADKFKKHDRIKASKLFDIIPSGLDEDIRIQNLRSTMVPPKVWENNSIVIYCGKGNGLEWAYPSIFKGIGGSEEAVINMSEQLTTLGYKVTVYNHCGSMRGEYNGVEYLPFYHFDSRDRFDKLIAWRTPGLFNYDIKAKNKIVWLHDIAYPQQFNEKIIKNTDKFIFLSKWHRNNMPSIPDEKIFISNNGINPRDFETLPEKRPNSLFWGASYDRGLLCLIKDIMPLVIKEIPDVTLDVCYGWTNIDKEIETSPGIYPQLEELRRVLTPLLEQHYINHHNRVGHKELAQIMGSCICYPYSSEFGETNNITSQKCQAANTYVITTSQAGGTPERVIFGEVLKGDNIYTDKDFQVNFAKKVVEYLKSPKNSTVDVKEAFSWETTAKSWKDGLL